MKGKTAFIKMGPQRKVLTKKKGQLRLHWEPEVLKRQSILEWIVQLVVKVFVSLAV